MLVIEIKKELKRNEVDKMIRVFDFHKMPIVDVVNEILYDSAKRGASDIHFDPRSNHMVIRIRIDG